MSKLIETAPDRIFLQIGENTEAFDNPFPNCSNDEVTWCQDSVLDCEVEYIKEAAHKAEVEALQQQVAMLNAAIDSALNTGIYPKAVVGGEGSYQHRSEYMEGWNDAVTEISKNFTATESTAAAYRKEVELLKARVRILREALNRLAYDETIVEDSGNPELWPHNFALKILSQTEDK